MGNYYFILSNFITKLNLQYDFSFRQIESQLSIITLHKNSFEATLSPNPSNNLIKLIITESDKPSIVAYTVSVVNQIGNIVLKRSKYISGHNLDISGLKSGTYYVEILNSKGEKLSKIITKL